MHITMVEVSLTTGAYAPKSDNTGKSQNETK